MKTPQIRERGDGSEQHHTGRGTPAAKLPQAGLPLRVPAAAIPLPPLARCACHGVLNNPLSTQVCSSLKRGTGVVTWWVCGEHTAKRPTGHGCCVHRARER